MGLTEARDRYFVKPPHLGLVCCGKVIDGYEVQAWTFWADDIFSDPYADVHHHEPGKEPS